MFESAKTRTEIVLYDPSTGSAFADCSRWKPWGRDKKKRSTPRASISLLFVDRLVSILVCYASPPTIVRRLTAPVSGNRREPYARAGTMMQSRDLIVQRLKSSLRAPRTWPASLPPHCRVSWHGTNLVTSCGLMVTWLRSTALHWIERSLASLFTGWCWRCALTFPAGQAIRSLTEVGQINLRMKEFSCASSPCVFCQWTTQNYANETSPWFSLVNMRVKSRVYKTVFIYQLQLDVLKRALMIHRIFQLVPQPRNHPFYLLLCYNKFLLLRYKKFSIL